MKPFLKSGTSDRALGLAITGAALLLPAYGQASAQQVGQPSDTIEEIVVTAQKRNENMQSTPIAISAFTGDSIAKKGLADIQQVARLAPNVSFDFTAPVSGASTST